MLSNLEIIGWEKLWGQPKLDEPVGRIQFGSLRNFLNPIISKLDKHVVLLPILINYIASKNRWTWQIYDSLKYRKFSKYADGYYQHKTKPCCNLIGRYLVHFMLTFDWFMESIQIFLIFNVLFKAKGNVPGKTTYPLYFKFGQLAKINKK